MFWKSKKQKDKTIDDGVLYRNITQDVVMNMMSMHVIKSPELKFFMDDKGLLDGLVQEHITEKKILDLKKQDDFTYMFVCGMHALGAGIYVTLFQTKVKKPINEFGQKEMMEIALNFSNTDAYELALSTMGLNTNSNNKRVFDQIIITAIKSAMNCVGNDATSPETIRQLMRVLYNAGITVVMR